MFFFSYEYAEVYDAKFVVYFSLKNQKFLRRSPWIHETLIKTLIVHCTCHNQFTASSNLITSINTISHSSPTADYFETILKTATRLLGGIQISQLNSSSPDSLTIAVISWTKSIFEEAKKFEQQHHTQQRGQGSSSHGVVMSNRKFRTLFFALVNLSCKQQFCKAIAEPSLALIKIVLRDFPLVGSHTQQVSEVVRECAMLHLKSTAVEIQELACEILCLIPPMIGHWITNNDFNKHVDLKESMSLVAASKLDEMKMVFVGKNNENLKPTDFKILMDDLLKNPNTKNLLQGGQIKILKHLEIFSAQGNGLEADEKQLVECIETNSDLQSFWVGYQLAQYCVNNKLRTPLGKAQETLTTIEKVIRQLTTNASAATVVKPTTESVGGNTITATITAETVKPSFVLNVSECRRLLTFFELLEKTMANAWDGSAYHWSGPSGGKPITSFFTANRRTCHDWLSRLRVTVVQLAFYIGEYAFAVRNAYKALGK